MAVRRSYNRRLSVGNSARFRPILILAMIAYGTWSFASAPTPDGHRSRAASPLKSHLMSYFDLASHLWNPDPWTYSVDDTASWKAERMPSSPAGLQYHQPYPSDSMPNWGTEAEECSLTVWRRFFVENDTIAFTMGRAPEACSEAPRMIWTDLSHRQHRRAVPPLFNWNIESLWCTENYLIFGLTAYYEGGGYDERLAFWNLGDGRVVLTPGVVWEDNGRMTRYEPSLPQRLPGWRQARVAEMRGGLLFAIRDTQLVFWPDRRAYCTSASHGRGSVDR